MNNIERCRCDMVRMCVCVRARALEHICPPARRRCSQTCWWRSAVSPPLNYSGVTDEVRTVPTFTPADMMSRSFCIYPRRNAVSDGASDVWQFIRWRRAKAWSCQLTAKVLHPSWPSNMHSFIPVASLDAYSTFCVSFLRPSSSPTTRRVRHLIKSLGVHSIRPGTPSLAS